MALKNRCNDRECNTTQSCFKLVGDSKIIFSQYYILRHKIWINAYLRKKNLRSRALLRGTIEPYKTCELSIQCKLKIMCNEEFFSINHFIQSIVNVQVTDVRRRICESNRLAMNPTRETIIRTYLFFYG